MKKFGDFVYMDCRTSVYVFDEEYDEFAESYEMTIDRHPLVDCAIAEYGVESFLSYRLRNGVEIHMSYRNYPMVRMVPLAIGAFDEEIPF